MSKLERLLNLTAALLETERPLTAEELRSRIDGYPPAGPSFRRAFERDKEDLREMGIPLSLEPVPGTDPPVDGYRIHKRDYYLPDAGLAPDELAALHLAATAVEVEGVSGAEALRKLGGRVGTGGDTQLVSLPADPNLSALFGAIAGRHPVRFGYRDQERSVEPHRLDYVRGRWYLTGHDRDRAAQRNFRLDRFDGSVIVDEADSFSRTTAASGARLAPWELGDDEPRPARLLVDADQAAWARQHVGDPVEQRPDGSVVVEVAVSDPEAFRSFVLTFLEHAEILEPPDLRADLVAWLEKIAP